MSAYLFRGRKAPSAQAPYQADSIIGGPTDLHTRKLEAWELAVGIRSPVAHPPGRTARPHRSNLPDVDLSLAVPFPTKPSRITMIAGWIRNGFRDPAKEERRHTLVRSL